MAKISEFRGLRPKKEYVSRVAVLPYDVVSVEEASRIADGNDICFFHVTKPEIGFIGKERDDHELYRYGKDHLTDMIDRGIMIQDTTPCFYIYTQVMEGREQTGLIACVSIDDYLDKIIKKHELTREDKERERTTHTDVINANTGQVFLFYKDTKEKRALLAGAMAIKPEYDFTTDDGVRQIVRVIEDRATIESLKEAFRDEILYIADGHHRAAAAVKVGEQRRRENPGYEGSEEFNRFMAVLFPHSQLKILAYNRVVRDLNGMSKEEFLGALSKAFNIEKSHLEIPGSVHSYCMYIDSEWYLLKPRFKPGDDPMMSLDVRIVQEKILAPILGIEDPRRDPRIDFVGGTGSVTELKRRVDSGEFAVAFSLYATGIEQLMGVSDMDGIMPPKSTWFEPKLLSGILVHLLG